MTYRELAVPDAWEITPVQHGDPRGVFLEWFQGEPFASAVGHAFDLRQANMSVSAAGVLRGIHFADVPPGQAKYVTCVRGAVLDVIVDLRVGSPTFGRWEGVRLDDVDRRAVYLSEGLGHGFCALTDDATLSYLCSTTYNPTGEHAVHPLDVDLAVEWPAEVPQLSARDAAAPTLAQALESGLLPEYDACRAFTASLRPDGLPYSDGI
jgi:dTDP-4-dehydrorhamnose 3,5-epimerase